MLSMCLLIAQKYIDVSFMQIKIHEGDVARLEWRGV